MPDQLQTLIARYRAEHDCKPGASPGDIQAAELRIGCQFTNELRELLQTCNGIDFWWLATIRAGSCPCRTWRPRVSTSAPTAGRLG